jgi:hypothetical protein
MATFDNIAGAEPSTVTFVLGSVTHARGSTTEHQEIVVIGGPDSSLAIGVVTNTTPDSTAWALAVREVVAQSTTVNVSSLAGAVNVRSSAANALVSVYQSTAADLNVTVAGYVAPSTTVQVSSLGGAVQARVYDSSGVGIVASTAAPATGDNALHVRQVGYSTTANVSSVAGIVAVRPSDTNWASSAGFHFTSSGELQTVASVTTSTTVNVSSLAGTVAVNPSGSSNSSVYFSVRLTNGTAFLSPAQDYTHDSTLTASTVTGPAVMLRASSSRPTPLSTSDKFVMQWGTLNGAAYNAIVTDSGASVMDSTNSAIKVNVVAGSVAGDTTVTASFAAGYVSTAAPAANSSGLIVWPVGYSTITSVSTGSVRVHQSSAADLNVTVAGYSTVVSVSTGSVRVHQSTAADLNVTVAGYSTTVNVSSLAGAVIVRSSAADQLVTVYQSTASALQATARINTSSGGAVEGSTVTPANNVIGLHVRQVMPTRASVVSTVTSSNSTSFYEIVSSAAGLTQCVYGYSITSTAASPLAVEILQSTVTVVWALDIGSGSSGVTGANLAITPPGYLFTSSLAGSLNMRLGSTGVQVRISVAKFAE